MTGIAYVNGSYIPVEEAAVNIEDRGFQFADGIYEVCLCIGGRYWDLDGHLTRMARSLREMRMPMPMSRAALQIVMNEIVRRNRFSEALVYVQATRGVASRNHAFPPASTPLSLVITAKRFSIDDSDAMAEQGIAVITQPDIRWGRVDIKTVSLLPNVLAKQAAKEAGAGEAWLVRDGKVTEGSSTNAWIVDHDGALVTHPKSFEILGGITRETAIACAEDLQIKVCERPFTVDEAKSAAEAFITSATNLVTPVTAIDGAVIGTGAPGPVARRLREAYKLRAKSG